MTPMRYRVTLAVGLVALTIAAVACGAVFTLRGAWWGVAAVALYLAVLWLVFGLPVIRALRVAPGQPDPYAASDELTARKESMWRSAKAPLVDPVVAESAMTPRVLLAYLASPALALLLITVGSLFFVPFLPILLCGLFCIKVATALVSLRQLRTLLARRLTIRERAAAFAILRLG